MIRRVPIPTTVNRIGCAPGGRCCSDCAATPVVAIAQPATSHLLLILAAGASLAWLLNKRRLS